MSGEKEVTLKDGYSLRAVEEASAWLALLHGSRRTRTLEEGFRRWIEASPRHEAAFDAVTAMWDTTQGLPRRPVPPPSRGTYAGGAGDARASRGHLGGGRAGRGGFGGFGAVAAMSVAILGIVILLHLLRSGAIATGIGEQRMLTLEDGTRVYLNTNSRVRVAYSNERRGVILESGEALFDVARHGPQWPFVVTAGTRQVTALGTSFVVREERDALSITLLEGNVSVSSSGPASEDARVLTPGQRLTFVRQRTPTLDRPAVEQVTAWRQGRIELDDTPLAAAVAEMNRYSTTPLRIERAEAAAIPIKGAFRAGDAESFAQSVAATCHLKIVPGPHEILLAGLPSANCQ
jgi:transmembrane sensor